MTSVIGTLTIGADEIVDVKLLIPRLPNGYGRAARHAYPGKSSIEPTTFLLREQNM
jgi:hypothetical protein